MLDIGHLRVDHRERVTVVVARGAEVTQRLAINPAIRRLVDDNPVAVWKTLLWFCGDHAAAERTIGDDTRFLIIFTARDVVVDARKRIVASVIDKQFGVYDLVVITGIQAASDRLQQGRSVWSSRIN